jgi:hypothetical protein
MGKELKMVYKAEQFAETQPLAPTGVVLDRI